MINCLAKEKKKKEKKMKKLNVKAIYKVEKCTFA